MSEDIEEQRERLASLKAIKEYESKPPAEDIEELQERTALY